MVLRAPGGEVQLCTRHVAKRNDERIAVSQITVSSPPPVRPIAKHLYVGGGDDSGSDK